MSNPLHAPFYADEALHETVEVVENERLARDTYRVRFACPELARRILPGQFVMLRLAGYHDPLIGRPLALYETYESGHGPEGVDVVYLVKGKFTSRLVEFLPGQELEVCGPLGNGFEFEPTEHLIMVAGGIGQTPFLAVAKEALGRKRYGQPARVIEPCQRVTFCYGARSSDLHAGVDDFRSIGVDVRLATDDGSAGHSGMVTDLLEQALDESEANHRAARIVCCGPEPMMQAVAGIADRRRTPCRVSLETPMACGVGICFTCVARVKDEAGQSDYKRTCVEGPVFDSACVEW